jgi:hypothetical protein
MLYRYLKTRQNIAICEIYQISQCIYYNTIATFLESHVAVKLCRSVFVAFMIPGPK